MRKEKVYSTKNVFSLLAIFIIIFWLLFSLASFWHENLRIQSEINTIRETNEKKLAQINENKQYLEYLKTPQRVDKEAKMQMGKKQPDENVLIFIENKLPVISSTKSISKKKIKELDIPIIEKWKWLFFGRQ